MQQRLISTRSALFAGSLVLFFSPAFADAQFQLPEPPQYRELGGDPLKSLAHYKVIWLKDKIFRENTFINSLKRKKKEVPDINKESVDADIKKYQDDIKQDEQDRDDLADLKAFDPANKKANANAKLVKGNVERWIATLDSEIKGDQTKPEEKKEAVANRTNLAKALEDAEKQNPNLFK